MQKELTYPIDMRTIGNKETAVHFEADPAECVALAERFNVPKVLSLRADLTVRRAGLIVLEGTFSARLIQTCVVSLDDFETTLSAPFKVFFDPALKTKAEPIIDIDVGDEEVEPVHNGIIDAGAVVAEQFGLHLDLFPKKANRPFLYEDPLSPEEEEQKHPFHVLKNLIKK